MTNKSFSRLKAILRGIARRPHKVDATATIHEIRPAVLEHLKASIRKNPRLGELLAQPKQSPPPPQSKLD